MAMSQYIRVHHGRKSLFVRPCYAWTNMLAQPPHDAEARGFRRYPFHTESDKMRSNTRPRRTRTMQQSATGEAGHFRLFADGRSAFQPQRGGRAANSSSTCA